MAAQKTQPILGRNALVTIIGHAKKVPAKVDTGADSSSIWASGVHIDEHDKLHYVLFDKDSPFYTGEEVVTDEFTVAKVRSSTGHTQIRYQTSLTIKIGKKRVRALFNLSDRSKNNFPVLVGRRTLNGKFLVDVTRKEHHTPKARVGKKLHKELIEDPHGFHKKYYDFK